MRGSFCRLSVLVAAVVLSFGACTGRDSPTDVTHPDTTTSSGVSSVAVELPVASLEVGAVANAVATSTTASGAVFSGATINWLSSDNSILTVSSYGTVSARRIGTAWVYATNHGVAGRISVSVTDSAPAALHVSPRNAIVRAGSSIQLTTTIATSTGRAVSGHSVQWASGDTHIATVSATGLVTAVSAGAVRIIATASRAADTSVLTVSASSTTTATPPPPVATSGTSHEPTVMRTLQDWDGHSLGAWISVRQPTQQFVWDAGLQKTVMQLQYGPVVEPANSTYGVGHLYIPLRAPAPLHTVYLRAQIKLSANWVQNPSQVLKLFELLSGRTLAIPGIYGSGSHLRLMVANDESTDRNYPGCFIGQKAPDCKVVTPPPDNFTLDAWHTIEVLMVSNTPGLNNGRVKTWLDGKPQTDVSDVMWAPAGADNSFREFDLNPLWGGLGGTIRDPQWLSLGEIHLSGTNQYIVGQVP